MSILKAKAITPFYDTRAGTYWIEQPGNRWLELSTADLNLHLKHSGLDSKRFVGNLNELESAHFVAQTERCVDYAGPIAGYRTGLHKSGDKRLLVTRTFNLLPVTRQTSKAENRRTSKVDSCTVAQFFDELLGSSAPFLYAWLKIARECLSSGVFRPGQMLVFAGESGCGKSLAQTLITELLGGRSAKPYRYMIGETPFNSELAAAEHLMIEDENSSSDIRSRRKFGASLKDFTVNLSMSVHAKGREAITLTPFHRLTLSCNSETENLMILPPLDASILDKLMLFRCGKATVNPDRAEYWKALSESLPELAGRIDTMKIPKPLQCERYGVKAWHDPELLSAVNEVSPEHSLRVFIDDVLWQSRDPKVWKGTAKELERELLNSPFKTAVEKLLYWPTACGVYLARLAAKNQGVEKLAGEVASYRVTPIKPVL